MVGRYLGGLFERQDAENAAPKAETA